MEASLPASPAQTLPQGNVRGDFSGLFPKPSLESRMEECVRLAAAACSLLLVPLPSQLPRPPSPPRLLSPHSPSSLPAPLPRAEFTATSPESAALWVHSAHFLLSSPPGSTSPGSQRMASSSFSTQLLEKPADWAREGGHAETPNHSRKTDVRFPPKDLTQHQSLPPWEELLPAAQTSTPVYYSRPEALCPVPGVRQPAEGPLRNSMNIRWAKGHLPQVVG